MSTLALYENPKNPWYTSNNFTMTTDNTAPISAAEAVARAKEIAAKLALTTALPADISTDNNKRKRWGTDDVTDDDPYKKTKPVAGALAGVPGQYGPSGSDNSADAASNNALNPLVGAPAVAAAFGLGYAPTEDQTKLQTAAASGQLETENIGVPNHLVGYIIGRGGESIAKMQRQTGCRVQIQKEHEMAPGATNRVITLSSTSADAIDECRQIIEGMVQEKSMVSSSTSVNMSSGSALGGSAIANYGQPSLQMQVPDGDVGLVIGKGGMNIKSIQAQSQAIVQIPQIADADNPMVRTITISAPTKEGTELAKALIESTLANKVSAPSMNEVSLDIEVPDKDVGMVIGKGGCVIKEMQNKTRCRVQIPQMCAPGNPNRLITINGPPDGVTQVKSMIERIIMEQSSHFVMQGAAFSNGYGAAGYDQYQGSAYGSSYGQQYGAPQYGQQQYGQQQQDYSAEWAAYYAAQAQQGSAQATATATVATAATTVAPAATTATSSSADAAATDPTAYYDDFWRYVAYYGEEAARQYYGAWSPPEGTPNPYADGTTPAPATSTTDTASTLASQPATAQPEAKDSSVREGVSNLPAWMTQGQS